MPQFAEQINEARRNGYTDDEITGFLKQKADLAPKIQEAIGSGYSPSEILQHLAPPPPVIPPRTFKQEAGRLAGIAMESSGQKFATDLLGGGSKAVMDFITGSPQDPRNTERFLQAGKGLVGFVRDEPHRMADQLQKSGDAMLRGDINAAADHLWFSIPFAGAAGQKMKEYLDQGDVSGALTHALGTLAPIARKPVVETGKPGGGGPIEAIKVTPTAVKAGAKGAYKAAISPKTRGEAGASFATGLVFGPKTGAAMQTALTGRRMVVGAVSEARQALKARAQAAAEALAAERAAAQPAPVQLIPESRRLASPPDTSYVRAVPAEPLPPSRQLAAPGRPAIITPEPDAPPDTSFVRSVPGEYPEVLSPTLRKNPAAATAAEQMREEMIRSGTISAEDVTPVTRKSGAEKIVEARNAKAERFVEPFQRFGFSTKDVKDFGPSEWESFAKAIGEDVPSPDTIAQIYLRMSKRK